MDYQINDSSDEVESIATHAILELLNPTTKIKQRSGYHYKSTPLDDVQDHDAAQNLSNYMQKVFAGVEGIKFAVSVKSGNRFFAEIQSDDPDKLAALDFASLKDSISQSALPELSDVQQLVGNGSVKSSSVFEAARQVIMSIDHTKKLNPIHNTHGSEVQGHAMDVIPVDDSLSDKVYCIAGIVNTALRHVGNKKIAEEVEAVAVNLPESEGHGIEIHSANANALAHLTPGVTGFITSIITRIQKDFLDKDQWQSEGTSMKRNFDSMNGSLFKNILDAQNIEYKLDQQDESYTFELSKSEFNALERKEAYSSKVVHL